MNKVALIEEYLQVECEVAFDFFVENGHLVLASSAYRIFEKGKFGIELGHINPWKPPKELIALSKKVAEKLGVTFGPLKLDYIYDKRYGWILEECATRLSGGFDHMVTGKLIGKDVTGVMLDVALGKPANPTKLVAKKDKFACAYAPLQSLVLE